MRIIQPSRIRNPKLILYVSKNAHQIYFNAQAIKTTKLKAGNRVLFAQDENDESVFYLIKAKNQNGFLLQSNNRCALYTGSKEFANLLRDTFNSKSKKIELSISDKPIMKDGIEAFVLLYNNLDEI